MATWNSKRMRDTLQPIFNLTFNRVNYREWNMSYNTNVGVRTHYTYILGSHYTILFICPRTSQFLCRLFMVKWSSKSRWSLRQGRQIRFCNVEPGIYAKHYHGSELLPRKFLANDGPLHPSSIEMRLRRAISFCAASSSRLLNESSDCFSGEEICSIGMNIFTKPFVYRSQRALG